MQKSFQYGGRKIPYDISYSRQRKTIQISVEATGQVKITAPTGLSEKEIISRVQTRGGWIVKKIDEIQHRRTYAVKKEFIDGESFLVMGQDCTLQLLMDPRVKKASVTLHQGKLIITTPTGDEEPLKRALEAWYRSKAREVVEERLNYYQPLIGASPANIRIKEQKKRWGSCSSKGNLNFNWRIIMAPLPVLDYIVVHELCHLVHLNHSKEFWNLLGSILPDYKQRRDWLKKNGARMTL